MPKPFLVVIISLLLIWILLLRAVFLIEDNSELLAEFSLDTIAEDAEGLSDFELFITNRWGNVMYQCSGTTDPEFDCRWDGTDQTGKKVAQGTYFYIINAKAEGNQKIQQHSLVFDPSKYQKRGMKNTFQGAVYNFLERPTGWKCFVYHFTV